MVRLSPRLIAATCALSLICLLLLRWAADQMLIYKVISTWVCSPRCIPLKSMTSTNINRTDVIERILSSKSVRLKTQSPRCANVSIKSDNTAKFLYAKEGQVHPVHPVLKDEKLSPLTRWTQEIIFKHQHPSDCKKASFLISQGQDAGMGSMLHTVGTHLAYAMQNNLILIWGPATCNQYTSKDFCGRAMGCSCLFKQTSNCTYSVAVAGNHTIFKRQSPIHIMMDLIPDIFRSTVKSVMPSITDRQLRFWWRGQSAAYLMRFNDNTLNAVYDLRMDKRLHYVSESSSLPFPLPGGTMFAHIRHGDKVREMTLQPWNAYMQKARQMVENMPLSYSRFLVVSSDDPEAIHECRRYSEQLNWTFSYLNSSSFQNTTRMSTLGLLLQILMALEADAWIGTRGSNLSRLIDELRCIWVDKCQNSFAEVGRPTLGW